jgi:soluble lytic murein transglycosylase
MLSLLGVSAASMAAGVTAVRPASVAKMLPAAAQGTMLPAQPVQPPPAYSPYSASPGLSSAIARWNSLRQSDGLPFSSYASFLLSYRGWPGEAAMRRTAEKAIDPGSVSAVEVVSFFRTFPPLTPPGHARHAFALLATGQIEQAREAARKAWQSGVLPRPDEDRLLGLFGGALTQSDHDRRIDVLLANRDLQSAQRVLPLSSAGRRPLFETRLALQTRAGDAASRLAMLGSTASGDAGLLMDKANWLRNSGQSLAARQLLAGRPPLTQRPANPETWFETLLTMANGAANDRQWSTAWQIASRLDDAYPAGTDVSAQPYGERDAYTSLAWLAGSAALHQLGRPADAVRMFDSYARAARSPQTRSKGFYWAARAAKAAGQAQQVASYLEQAAASPDQYYGQLALERLGRPIVPPMSTTSSPGAVSFSNPMLAEATRVVGQMGQWSDQTLFVRALAQQVDGDQERALAADYGRRIGRPDLGVWVAREARSKGANFYARPGFPEVQIPGGYARHWTLAHAITRQESSFDRAAVSHAGARGLMQLMPGTARETAGKLGLSYDFSRLTSDPSYNMTLGTSYLSTLLDQWGGSVPLAVASYNAGTGNVRKWVRDNGDPRMPGTDVVRWIEEIPFSETRNYVQRVLENAVVYDLLSPQPGPAPSRNRLSDYLGKRDPG